MQPRTFTAMAGGARKERPKRTLTEEQKEICSIRLMPGQVMLIEAFAGAAKTSTLEEYAAAHADLSFLYMAFNATAATDAAQRFPESVVCKTQHSLAFADKGRIYKEKLNNLRPKTLMGPLNFSFSAQAQTAIEAINSFLHSADEALAFEHLPLFVRTDPELSKQEKIKLLETVKLLWKRMCDPEDKVIPMPHDGYLKLWQLEMQKTGKLPNVFRKFDVILLDEAQDTNPTMEAIVRAAIKAGQHRIILVGDGRQNIYGFRGSVNLMERMAGDIHSGKLQGAVKHLTSSFRYTPEIASVATHILNADADVYGKRVNVKGLRPSTDTDCRSEAIIARSNGGLIGAAIAHLVLNPKAKIHFAATSEKDGWNPTQMYRFDSLMGVWLHKYGNSREGKDPYIKTFGSYKEITEFAKGDENRQGADKELDSYVRLVEKYGRALPEHLDRIIANCGSMEDAMCFSTAHRSKGLEWDRVTLLDDFEKSCKMEMFKSTDPLAVKERPSHEELNLLYVAATRPRKVLVPHPDLAEFLEWRVDQNVTPEAEEDAAEASARRDQSYLDEDEEIEPESLYGGPDEWCEPSPIQRTAKVL